MKSNEHWKTLRNMREELTSYKEINLQNRLRECRIREDYTQEELAILVGTSRNTICSIESGKYYPTIKLAMALAEILNEEIDYLFYNGDKGKWRYEHQLRKLELDQKKSE